MACRKPLAACHGVSTLSRVPETDERTIGCMVPSRERIQCGMYGGKFLADLRLMFGLRHATYRVHTAGRVALRRVLRYEACPNRSSLCTLLLTMPFDKPSLNPPSFSLSLCVGFVTRQDGGATWERGTSSPLLRTLVVNLEDSARAPYRHEGGRREHKIKHSLSTKVVKLGLRTAMSTFG